VQVGGVYVGLFKGGFEGGSCVKYGSGSDLSTALKTARAFGVLLTLGLSFAMILVICVVLVYPNKIMWNAYRVLLSFCIVFNLLTFVAFAECADVDYLFTCTVGGASVCAILNSWLLLALSIMSCCVPLPEEPVFKNVSFANESNNTTTTTIKRTIEETLQGKTITEEVTDTLGNTTTTTTFEPSEHHMGAVEGFNVGPTVNTIVTNLPNGKKVVEEDAQGNKTITTKIVVMAGEEDPNIVVGSYPQPYDNSGDAIMAAAVPMPVGGMKHSYQIDDEECGMANPYISSSNQERHSHQGASKSRHSHSSRPTSYANQDDYPKSNHEHNNSKPRSTGQTDYGADKPYQPSDKSGYLEDSASSGFTDNSNYDSTFIASTSTYDDSFADSSGNFDSSFAPDDSGALDGVGEGKPKKKKKKKKHKHHHSSEQHHESSRHRKREKEQSEPVAKEAEGGEGRE